MLAFFLWYLIVSLIGLAAFPLAYRLLPALPDRGYAFSRMLGLMAWGYAFWLPGVLGLLRNDLGGLVLALAVLVAMSALTLRGGKTREILAWLHAQRAYLVPVEALFLLAFAGMALVRAANPELNYTEKPMELAFINALLRSPGLPPHDPWLSGYAISYYYFGYLLVAMLARLSGVAGSVAHNLGTALVFGLSAIGAYGVVYNLLKSTAGRMNADGRPATAKVDAAHSESHLPPAISHLPPSPRPILLAFLGPLFVLLISNLEGLLEVLHARGLFWRAGAEGQLSSAFWSWLGILDLNQPPAASPSWLPRQFGTGQWWWWRASRVVSDYNFLGEYKEVIDEFPFFAFLHADLHPHVLAIPFAFLALGVALNLYLGGGGGEIRLPFRLKGLASSLLHWELSKESFLLAALVLGGMFLLNAWDFPIYVALAGGAYAFGRMQDEGERMTLKAEGGKLEDEEKTSLFILPPSSFILDFLSLALALGLAGILLYLPFYLGFASQASGIVPSLVYFTRGAHLWVMFGALLLPLGAYLVYLWRLGGSREALKTGLAVSLGLVLGLWVLMVLFMYLRVLAERLAPAAGAGLLAGDYGAPAWGILLREALQRRLAAPGAWLTLAVLLAAAAGLLFGRSRKARDRSGSAQDPLPPIPWLSSPIPFSLLLIFFGALLVLGPEFFYLRDLFGWRINTIFKFYFQAWLLWGVAAAYGSALLLLALRGAWRAVFRAGLALVAGMALLYPLFGLIDKTNGFNPPGGWTLDGAAYLEQWSPDEQAAVRWLQSASPGTLVEAVCPGGGSFRAECARFSTLTGLPAVIGWTWHETQWRGSDELFRDRPGEVELLYTTRDWSQTEAILHRYNIRYIVIGPRERETYTVYERKFEQRLIPAFRQGEVAIYEVSVSVARQP